MAKILFINLYETNYLGTRCLASYLRQHGHDTHNLLVGDYHHDVVEKPAEGEFVGYHIYLNGIVYEQPTLKAPLTVKEMDLIVETIKEEKPDIIAYSSRSTHNFLAPRMVRAMRKGAPNALLACGGFGPTLEPEVFLDAGFDVVLRGDGEETLLELTAAWEKQDKETLLKIPNTVWSPNMGGNVNSLRDQKKDLTDYPAPLSGNEYFSFLHDDQIDRYVDPVLSRRSYYTFFGRGCIGTCSYCSGGNWQTLYRNEGKKAYKRRNRSIDSVIQEILSLPKNVNRVVFCDEYWGNSTAKTKEFFEKYGKECGLPFFAYLDYNHIANDPELLDTAINAGFYATGIGFQTGSKEFAKKYYHRNQNYPLLLKYAHILFKNKIHINPQFIGGNCYETEEDFQQTLDIVRQLPFNIECPHVVQLQVTQLKAHPKSPLREIAPKVVTNPAPTKEWHYKAVLLDLARLVDKETFDKIRQNQDFQANPEKLHSFTKKLLFQKQYEHFKNLVVEKQNKPWIYYGLSQSYQRNKEFFAPLNAEYILLDEEYMPERREIDGIPIITPGEFFAKSKLQDYNFMVFASEPWHLEKALIRKYKVPFDNIHSCASSWPSPFAADKIRDILGSEYA